MDTVRTFLEIWILVIGALIYMSGQVLVTAGKCVRIIGERLADFALKIGEI